jgi:Uma2 family endonuclease
MTSPARVYTAEEFDIFIEQPENAERLWELIAGEIFEVPSNPYVSAIAAKIIILIGIYLLKNKIGHLTGEAGGYMVAGERYAPDVAFISYEKQPQLVKIGYNPNPPDLAVEVISSDSSEERDKLRIKITNYLSVGTVVWIVKPEDKLIELHQAGKAVIIFREADTINGGDILPDFKMKVADVFEQ